MWEIARLTPVFLCFCPSICDFVRVQSVLQKGELRPEHALNHKKTTKSQKPEFCPSLRLPYARIFVQEMPVFFQK